MTTAAPHNLAYERSTPSPRLVSVTGRPFTKLGRIYLLVLGIALLGYALGGRGFAYWGIGPIFVGEITLTIGLCAMIQSRRSSRVLMISEFLPLILFMIWGLMRTVPYFGLYGIAAARDAVIWGYGLFALATAAVLISVPERMPLVLRYYAKFAVLFLLIQPILWVAQRALGGVFPEFPLTGQPMIEIKGGDTCVHLAGIFCYLVCLGRSVNPWVGPLLIPLNLGMNIHGRAGMVSFALGVVLAFMLRPFHPRAMRIFAVIGLGLFLLWATDLKIGDVGGGREISFDYLTRAINSIVNSNSADEDLAGTKEWRLKWWTTIVDYTLYGDYFWTGKGFGINLADDDGFQIDGTLRSPHNGHLTILARAGVPGLALWIVLHLVFIYSMVRSYLRARRRKDWKWAGVFVCLTAYWGALMCNASFDVFLEGPMGGIWLWSIYGVGIASVYIFKRYPYVLYMEPVVEKRPTARKRAARKQQLVRQPLGAPVPRPMTSYRSARDF